MSNRIASLDMAKGTAIILVVIGHIVARDDLAPGAEWYADLRALIYLFHMPLFMVLSGMALGVSWRHRASSSEVGELVARRFRQLAIPFLLFGVIVLLGKLFVSQWTRVDNPASGFTESLLAIVLNPMRSPSAFLWYIQVLAIYYLVVPWLMQASARWAPPLLLAVGLAAQLGTWPTLLSLNVCIEYLPFFAAGLLLGQYWPVLLRHVLHKQTVWLWLAPFVAALAYGPPLETPVPKWLAGAASVPFILTLHQWPVGKLRDALNWAGRYTLSIYLMNTIYIGLSKTLLKPIVPYRDDWFILFFIALGLAGLLLPVLTKKAVERWRPSWAAYL